MKQASTRLYFAGISCALGTVLLCRAMDSGHMTTCVAESKVTWLEKMGQFFWRIIARMGLWVRFKLFEMKEFRRFELHKFTAGILKIQALPRPKELLDAISLCYELDSNCLKWKSSEGSSYTNSQQAFLKFKLHPPDSRDVCEVKNQRKCRWNGAQGLPFCSWNSNWDVRDEKRYTARKSRARWNRPLLIM